MSKKTAPTNALRDTRRGKKAAKKTALRDTRRGTSAVANKAASPKKRVVAKKVAPKKVAPKKAASKKVAPKKVATKKVAPKTAAPKKAAPKKAAPKKVATKKVATKTAAPKKVVAKATPPGKPAAAATPPPRSAASLPGATNPVKAHAWKDVSVTLDGDVHKVIFFDWATLSSGARDPSPTAKYQPTRNPFSWVEEFDEYIVGHWLDPVDEGDWEPIGVVGLGHASTTESFAEMNNRGFLAVVKGGGSFPAGTVLWLDGPRYDKDQPFIVGPHVDVLQITRR